MLFRALNIEFCFPAGWILFSDCCGLYLIIYLASLTNQVSKSAVRAQEAISLCMHPASLQSLQINTNNIKFSAAIEMYKEITYKKLILWFLTTKWWNSQEADQDYCQIIVLFSQMSWSFSKIHPQEYIVVNCFFLKLTWTHNREGRRLLKITCYYLLKFSLC